MTRSRLRAQLDAAQANLAKFTTADLEAILDVIADTQRGYRSGHEPTGHTPTPGHAHDCECDGCAPPPGYSDRTGELAITSGRDTATQDAKTISRAVLELWRSSVVLADFRDRLANRAPVVRYCRSCRRDSGRQELVAAGRYADLCRWCGESESRNGGQETPLALLRAHHRDGAGGLTDQLIAAHPLPSGKLWKRPKQKRPANA